MESPLNFGRLYVQTIQKNAGGPFFYDGRLAKKTPYQHAGMRLLWQFFLLSVFFKPQKSRIHGLFYWVVPRQCTKRVDHFYPGDSGHFAKTWIPFVHKIPGLFHCLLLVRKDFQQFCSRLQDAGAEGRIWPTQFGFRSGCCCMDALFIARRNVENAWARKHGNLLQLALD